jgi:hypothetical protein
VTGRFEPLRLALSSLCRSMGVLGPIIEISTLSVLDARKQLTLSDAIALQLVGRTINRGSYCRPLSSRLKGHCAGPERGCRANDAILIDGAPKVVLHTLDANETSSLCPLSPVRGRRQRRLSAKLAANFCTTVAPSRMRLGSRRIMESVSRCRSRWQGLSNAAISGAICLRNGERSAPRSTF